MLQRCFIVCRVPKVVKSCTIALYSDITIRRQNAAIRKTFYCQKTSKICCDSKRVSRNFLWITYSNGNFVLMVMCFRYLPQSFARCSNVKRLNVQPRKLLCQTLQAFVARKFPRNLVVSSWRTTPMHNIFVHIRSKLKVKFNFLLQTTFGCTLVLCTFTVLIDF